MAAADFEELKKEYMSYHQRLGQQEPNDRQLLHVQNQLDLRVLIQKMEAGFPKRNEKPSADDEYIMCHAYSCIDKDMISENEKDKWLKHTESYLSKYVQRPMPNNDLARLAFVSQAMVRMTDSNEKRYKAANKALGHISKIKFSHNNPDFDKYLAYKRLAVSSRESFADAYYKDLIQEASVETDDKKKEGFYIKAKNVVEHMTADKRIDAHNEVFNARRPFCRSAEGLQLELEHERKVHRSRIFKGLPREIINARNQRFQYYN